MAARRRDLPHEGEGGPASRPVGDPPRRKKCPTGPLPEQRAPMGHSMTHALHEHAARTSKTGSRKKSAAMIAGAGRRLRTRQNHLFDQQEPKIAPAGEGEGSVWSGSTTSTQGKIGKGPLEKARFWPPAPFSVMRIEAQRASEEDRSPHAFPHANTWLHFRKRRFGWCRQA